MKISINSARIGAIYVDRKTDEQTISGESDVSTSQY